MVSKNTLPDSEFDHLPGLAPGAYGYPTYHAPLRVPGHPSPLDQKHPVSPLPSGKCPPPLGAPNLAHQIPPAGPNSPASAQSSSQPGHYRSTHQTLWYLGTAIPDPCAPAAHYGGQKVPGYNPALAYETLVNAIDNLDYPQVCTVLLSLDVFRMDALWDCAISKTGENLMRLLNNKLSKSDICGALGYLTLGPLWLDVHLAKTAFQGVFTKDKMVLTELILGRSGDEIRLLNEGYRLKHGKTLVSDVEYYLSGKTERMFIMALNAQRPPDHLPVDDKQVAVDIENLYRASKKKDESPFFEVIINRSNPHLAAVITGFGARYKSLSRVIKQTFSGDIVFSLVYIIQGVKSKRDGQGFWRDAKLLEQSMAGSDYTRLCNRLIRAHWDPIRLEAIKEAYKRRYEEPLEDCMRRKLVACRMSKDYQDLLQSIANPDDIIPPSYQMANPFDEVV